MARYKPYSYAQGKFIPIHFDNQILPGTFEYTLSHLIDHEIDLSIFNDKYRNDETGAPAYDPRILLKIILFAYSRGITSSRRIARACCENVIFMALSADTRPHFTTIADFISGMDKEIVQLFLNVLLVCDEQGLIGREMFAIDGCKLPGNASKEWSGTRKDFKRKAARMEKAIERMVSCHHGNDLSGTDKDMRRKDEKYVRTLRRNLSKVREWLDNNDDRMGKGGKPVKSNITDNESAKMKTAKGVIQGYVGVSVVDGKKQVIVASEAYGQGHEHDLLEPMINQVRDNFITIDRREEDVFTEAKLAADAGFHSEANMKMLAEHEIDGYVADNQFRRRDPRFAGYDRYKQRSRKERAKREGRLNLFSPSDFVFAEDLSSCICPAGKKLYRNGANIEYKGHISTRFKGTKGSCLSCGLRSKCLRYPDRTEIRQVAYFHGTSKKKQDSFTERMKRKIDSAAGRAIYSMRLAIGEPPFAHIRSAMKLDRFTLRGKNKVDVQWKLFTIVHNLKKIHSYGIGFA